MLVVPEFMFFPASASPAAIRASASSRADAYAMPARPSRSDLVQALVKLYKDNAATPDPGPRLHSAFYDSPPAPPATAHRPN